jgi:hypothetical protein
LDHHIPNMTVLETCQFAFNCLHSTDESARLLAEFGQVGVGRPGLSAPCFVDCLAAASLPHSTACFASLLLLVSRWRRGSSGTWRWQKWSMLQRRAR